jgi:hypothetical protein
MEETKWLKPSVSFHTRSLSTVGFRFCHTNSNAVQNSRCGIHAALPLKADIISIRRHFS